MEPSVAAPGQDLHAADHAAAQSTATPSPAVSVFDQLHQLSAPAATANAVGCGDNIRRLAYRVLGPRPSPADTSFNAAFRRAQPGGGRDVPPPSPVSCSLDILFLRRLTLQRSCSSAMAQKKRQSLNRPPAISAQIHQTHRQLVRWLRRAELARHQTRDVFPIPQRPRCEAFVKPAALEIIQTICFPGRESAWRTETEVRNRGIYHLPGETSRMPHWGHEEGLRLIPHMPRRTKPRAALGNMSVPAATQTVDRHLQGMSAPSKP